VSLNKFDFISIARLLDIEVAVSILNNQLPTSDKGWSSSLGGMLDVGIITTHNKIFFLRKISQSLGFGRIVCIRVKGSYEYCKKPSGSMNYYEFLSS
jgi:hypothetical protein